MLPSLKKNDIVKVDWDEELARAIEKPLGRSMELGAGVAQEELGEQIVDWTLQNPKAQQFVREHSLKLAKDINKTTEKKLKSALLTGLNLGEGKDALAKRVGAVLTDAKTWRSKLIAQTETIRAYSQGSLQLYKEGGIAKKQWLDGQANACPICEDLDGVIVNMNESFPGGYDAPPDPHPGCRCAVVGIR